MPKMQRNGVFIALIALALVLIVTLARGQDANWDLLNYHLYTPLAWLDGRLDQDIAAAQLQSWHNPIVDMPLALLVRAGASGWLVTLWLALPAVIALFFALRLLDTLWPAQRSLIRSSVAGFVAVSGAAVWSGTGTSYNDAYVAAGVVPALWWAVTSQERRGAWATWLPVGLLAGAAAGLKLTAAIYCVGFVAAAMICGPIRGLPSRMAALATGGLLAVILTWGPWAWLLWERLGNPLFPYFNQWFQSPDALPLAHKDERFRPDGLWEALRVPLRLLSRTSDFSEMKLRDPRLLLGLIALTGWAIAKVTTRKQAAEAAEDASPAGRTYALVLAFAIVSYVAWLSMYGIYRYLYPLELIFSIAIIGALSASVPMRWRYLVMLLAATVIVKKTYLPEWGHQPFRTPMVSVRFPELPPDSMVLISSQEPVAHAVVFLPRDVPALSLHNNFMDPERCTRLQSAVETRIASHRGPLFLLRQNDADAGSGRIGVYGLSIERCLPVQDSLSPMQLCPLSRATVNPTCHVPPAGR